MVAKTAKKTELEIVAPADVRAGMQIKVHQKIKDINSKGEEKERIQIFEGLVIARKHGSEAGGTFIVRKISEGVGVEKTFPIHSPLIDKVEIADRKVIRRSKIYFARNPERRLKSVNEGKKTSN